MSLLRLAAAPPENHNRFSRRAALTQFILKPMSMRSPARLARCHAIQRFHDGWLGNLVAIFALGPQVHFDGLLHSSPGFLQSPPGGDAAGKVAQVRYSLCAWARSKQRICPLETCLRVDELPVTSLPIPEYPPIPGQRFQQISNFHCRGAILHHYSGRVDPRSRQGCLTEMGMRPQSSLWGGQFCPQPPFQAARAG